MFFSIASTTGSDIGQRFAAFRNATSRGTRNRERTSPQNFSSGSEGVGGNGRAENPSSSIDRGRCAKTRGGRRVAEPESARNRAKSRRETLDTSASLSVARRMYFGPTL